MNYLASQLKLLVRFLSTQKIKYAILGGVAVAIYGEPRLTADVDVNIVFNRAKIKELLKTAKRYNLHPVFRDTEELAKKTGVIPMRVVKGELPGRVDIIIAENILEYNTVKRAKTKKITSFKIKIASPEDLIIHKITSSRPRDLEDLRGILIRQRGKLDTRYIRHWLTEIDKVDKRHKLGELFNSLLKEAKTIAKDQSEFRRRFLWP